MEFGNSYHTTNYITTQCNNWSAVCYYLVVVVISVLMVYHYPGGLPLLLTGWVCPLSVHEGSVERLNTDRFPPCEEQGENLIADTMETMILVNTQRSITWSHSSTPQYILMGGLVVYPCVSQNHHTPEHKICDQI